MEIKEEFYTVMTAHTAAIYHEELKMDFVLGNGDVSQLWVDGVLKWDKEKSRK